MPSRVAKNKMRMEAERVWEDHAEDLRRNGILLVRFCDSHYQLMDTDSTWLINFWPGTSRLMVDPSSGRPPFCCDGIRSLHRLVTVAKAHLSQSGEVSLLERLMILERRVAALERSR